MIKEFCRNRKMVRPEVEAEQGRMERMADKLGKRRARHWARGTHQLRVERKQVGSRSSEGLEGPYFEDRSYSKLVDHIHSWREPSAERGEHSKHLLHLLRSVSRQCWELVKHYTQQLEHHDE